MSDALPLPERPNLEQYKKLARELQRACKAGGLEAIREWAAGWAERYAALEGAAMTAAAKKSIAAETERIPRRWLRFQSKNERAARCSLADAQYFVALAHGFPSWPVFASHLEGLAGSGSAISSFEQAADAIVRGDADALRRLLRDSPELARTRSTREHGSTLLHYVSANGVEDFRQKTPGNIVEITAILLDAGADVNAESGAYGGGSTALGLTATSCHPEDAGVQPELMELLIGRGARVDGPDTRDIVNACLHNGRGEAAAFFAARGARLDLEGAAGVGRLDVVRGYFEEDGALKAGATPKQVIDGFTWACEFGRIEVIDFLVRGRIQADARLSRGETGLHWAAYGGHAAAVRLLLEHGARVDAIEEEYDGTPLGWALYGWGAENAQGSFYEAVALLARAGAKLEAAWFEGDEDRRRAAAKIRGDARMMAALGGEIV